jgi:hypothetical protein
MIAVVAVVIGLIFGGAAGSSGTVKPANAAKVASAGGPTTTVTRTASATATVAGPTQTVLATVTKQVRVTVTRAAAAATVPPAAPAPTPTAAADCTPGYSPCIPPGPDVDCAGGSGDGPRYVNGPVYVTGSDPYGLDADHNGVGCQ